MVHVDENWILVKQDGIILTFKNKHTGEVREYQGDICIIDPNIKIEKLELFIKWSSEIPIIKQIVLLNNMLNIDTKIALRESKESTTFSLGYFYKRDAEDIIKKAHKKGLELFY